MTFYGREDEIRLLREPNFRPQAQLIVVYGRRRVGKTALIEEAYKKEVLWKFEGLEAVSAKIQIKQFIEQLSEYSGDQDLRQKRVTDWREAFVLLFEKLKTKKGIILSASLVPADLWTVSAIVILVSVIASLQPALRASRMEPIDALRHV